MTGGKQGHEEKVGGMSAGEGDGKQHGVEPSCLGCGQERAAAAGGEGDTLLNGVFETLGDLALTTEPPPGLGKGHQSSNSNTRCTASRCQNEN